jgi:hypothetical protein
MPANCRPPGEICDPSFGECCPGVPQGKLLCLPGSYGVTRCQGPCCAFGGDPCQADADCCSKSCNMNSNTCDNGFACEVIGEDCMANADCCSGTCTMGKCADCTCVPTGGECSTPDDCCDGLCILDPDDGTYKCGTLPPPPGDGGAPTCIADGDACSSNGQCCSGLCGGGEFPQCQPSPCKGIGAGCLTTAECCAPLSCTNGICAQ